MKTVAMQLITVNLENGRRGVFVGVPLIREETTNTDAQVNEIWFSSVQEIPGDIPLMKLLQLVAAQGCRAGQATH